MLYDSAATDACFVDGRPPEQIDEIVEWARRQLGLNGDQPWRLISARRKMGRVLFEIEEETPSGPRRLIGKLGRAERAETLYETLRLLRDAGFRPPARYTVPEPFVCVAERGFVLQEKVPGLQVGTLIVERSARSASAAMDSADWLAALHRCSIPARPASIDRDLVLKWASELTAAQPGEAGRIARIMDGILQELDRPLSEAVPCHGDFHPMNIFIAGRERVTGIDIDKFARREPESDIGWFLMQTAAFGFFKHGSFECTAEARRAFAEHYETVTGRRVRTHRTALYMAMAFLKNLHFELVLLKTGRTQYTDPWLAGAAATILDRNLRL